jgi:hypothetical protein
MLRYVSVDGMGMGKYVAVDEIWYSDVRLRGLLGE